MRFTSIGLMLLVGLACWIPPVQGAGHPGLSEFTGAYNPYAFYPNATAGTRVYDERIPDYFPSRLHPNPYTYGSVAEKDERSALAPAFCREKQTGYRPIPPIPVLWGSWTYAPADPARYVHTAAGAGSCADTMKGKTSGTVQALSAAAKAPTPPAIAYTVNPGDTPYSIARQFGVPVQTLIVYNGIADPTKLRIGQRLQIPASAEDAADFPADRRIVKVLASTLTAYTAGYESTGKTPSHPQYGITYSGVRAKEGRTVAVDPAVIPLGSTILIEGIGIRQAEDVGSAIRGSKIDVYMEDVSLARKFGVKKNVKVYVLSDQDD